MSEVLEPQPIEGQTQDQAAHVAGQTAPEGTETQTNEGQEGEQKRTPRMVPVTAVQQERAKRRELAAELEYWKSQAAGRSEQQQTQQAPVIPAAPNPDKFSSREEYEAAVHKHFADIARQEAREEGRKAAREEIGSGKENDARQVALTGFQQRIVAAEASIPDIVDRVQELEESPLLPHIHQDVRFELLHSEHAPQLIQALTDDPALLQTLTGNPVRAAANLARLEARLTAAPAATQHPAAPPPGPAVKPTARVTGAAPAPARDLNDPNLSPEEFSRIWDEQRNSRRRR